MIRAITVRVFPSPISSARIPPLGESGFLSVEKLVPLLIHVDLLTCVQNGAKSVLFSLIIIQLRACSWWGKSCVVMACKIQIKKNILNVINNYYCKNIFWHKYVYCSFHSGKSLSASATKTVLCTSLKTEVTSLSCVPDKPQMILIFYIMRGKSMIEWMIITNLASAM